MVFFPRLLTMENGTPRSMSNLGWVTSQDVALGQKPTVASKRGID